MVFLYTYLADKLINIESLGSLEFIFPGMYFQEVFIFYYQVGGTYELGSFPGLEFNGGIRYYENLDKQLILQVKFN